MLQSLRKKCDPRRFPNMTGRMVALLDYLIGDGEHNTTTWLTTLSTTSDGFMMAHQANSRGPVRDVLFGTYSDAERNLESLLAIPAVGLTQTEAAYLRKRLASTRV